MELSFKDIIHQSSEIWQNTELKESVFGSQFVKGTSWNVGLKEDEIQEYEKVLNIPFSEEFKEYLSCMNGTKPEMIVTPYMRKSPGFYSYPKDLLKINEMIKQLKSDWPDYSELCKEVEIDVPGEIQFVPIFGNRFVLQSNFGGKSPVFSVYEGDAILYGRSIKEYLAKEINLK